MGITFIFIDPKNNRAMVKCKNCIQDRNNYIILLIQYRLFVNICTDNREEPGVHAAPADLQRETKAVMSCQAFLPVHVPTAQSVWPGFCVNI